MCGMFEPRALAKVVRGGVSILFDSSAPLKY